MKVIVEDIPPEGLHLQSSEEGDSFFREEEKLSFRSPVKIDVRVAKEGNKVLLSGTVETELELVCSRCLEPCRHSLSSQLDLIYYPLPSKIEGERELKEEDLLVSYYREGMVDIREEVRESIILTLPLKPLCRLECRGLCPHCGRNLNEEKCKCGNEQIDFRMAKLKELLK
ncbi:MAG: DUF177 domain-containing protein [Nitrospirae bacterium]|nr:DUF177 domain-containing protein [Nitrospirota bacterium]